MSDTLESPGARRARWHKRCEQGLKVSLCVALSSAVLIVVSIASSFRWNTACVPAWTVWLALWLWLPPWLCVELISVKRSSGRLRLAGLAVIVFVLAGPMTLVMNALMFSPWMSRPLSTFSGDATVWITDWGSPGPGSPVVSQPHLGGLLLRDIGMANHAISAASDATPEPRLKWSDGSTYLILGTDELHVAAYERDSWGRLAEVRMPKSSRGSSTEAMQERDESIRQILLSERAGERPVPP